MASQQNLSLLSRDYDTNLQLLKEYISARAPESWTSFFESDLGKMIIDVICYDYSMLGYILDAQTQECFIDTLRLQESLNHFASLTGYIIRRGSASSINVYAQVINPPQTGYYLIKAGTPVTSTNGVPFEVIKDTIIPTGSYTPVTITQRYGDIQTNVYDSSGNAYPVAALIKIPVGSSQATLVDYLGNRLSSEFGFSSSVGNGQVIHLNSMLDLGESTLSKPVFTSPPDITRDEFAITAVGKLSTDVYNSSVLFLDRPWDGVTDFIGQWVIEDRSVPLIQGESMSESFVAPAEVTNRENWNITSSRYPVISNQNENYILSGITALVENQTNPSGVIVTVDNVVWEETASLLFNTYSDNVFQVTFNQNDQAQITFGDGVFGALIPANATVRVSYRVGGGVVGNLPQNSFNFSVPVNEVISGNSTGTTGTNVVLTNSYTVGAGGQDKESISKSKANIVQFVRTNDRAATKEDYAYLASNFSSPTAGRVKYATAVLNTNLVPREQNIVWLYVWVEGLNGQLTAPTLLLKSSLLNYMNLRKMINDEVVILDGITNHVPIQFYYKYDSSITADAISESIASALNKYFLSLLPGDTIFISSLYEAVTSVPEVLHVNFLNPSDDYKAPANTVMLVNTLQQPRSTVLVTGSTVGQTSVVVNDPSIFYIGGVISLFEYGQVPTSAIVSGISDSVITLRPETPLKGNYSVNATVINSDYYPKGWQNDLAVDIYINYISTSGTSYKPITNTMISRIRDFFTYQVLPAESLLVSDVETVVSEVNGVKSFSVNFNTVDSKLDIITASLNDRVVIGNLVINGVSY